MNPSKIKYLNVIEEVIRYLFVILFIYAAVSKILDYQQFLVQLGQSPMLSAYAEAVSIAVPILEIITACLLITPAFKFTGLLISFNLMIMFTVYIIIILNFTDFIPCSCGGVLEELGWSEHLIFNLFFILLAAIGLYISVKDRKLLFNIRI